MEGKEKFLRELFEDLLIITKQDIDSTFLIFFDDQKREEAIDSLEKNFPQLWSKIKKLFLFASETIYEFGSESFVFSVGKGFHLFLLGVLPLYSAAKERWPFKEEKVISKTKEILERNIAKRIPQEKFEKETLKILKEKTGEFAEIWEEIEKELHFLYLTPSAIRYCIYLFLRGVYEATEVYPSPSLLG